MSQFNKYAAYYDSIYQDKPYEHEVMQLEKFIKQYSKIPVSNIVSLGCGTATYEILLAKKGFKIVGVDVSDDMLKIGQEKVHANSLNSKISLLQGDIRDINLDNKFDLVLMMFNIAGYLHTQKDFRMVTKNVQKYLKPGGLFIFDAWNKPAVEQDPPSDRQRTIKQGGKLITRKTKGFLDKQNKLVKIKFEILEQVGDKSIKTVSENHPMRYWEINKIQRILNTEGLQFIKATSFHDPNKSISDKEWDMYVIARQI